MCLKDLRSRSTLEQMQAYNDRIKKIRGKILQEQLNDKSKATIKWLVKYEYHL